MEKQEKELHDVVPSEASVSEAFSSEGAEVIAAEESASAEESGEEIEASIPAAEAACDCEPEKATVAHADSSGVTLRTAEDTDVASGNTAEPAAGYVSPEEVERLVGEAYLRGRNEAVRRRIIADSSLIGDRPGADSGFASADICDLFETRPSVWP